MPNAPTTFSKHARKRTIERVRGSKHERGYDAHWDKISRVVRSARPVCELCHDAPSQDVDHIVPFNGLRDPLRVEIDNLQAVCRPCHNRKHGRT